LKDLDPIDSPPIGITPRGRERRGSFPPKLINFPQDFIIIAIEQLFLVVYGHFCTNFPSKESYTITKMKIL
jgi:hypothetical protein